MILQFHSTEGQDRFVNKLLPPSKWEKRKFLDLGCGLPKKKSNTLTLERLGWNGLCLDKAPETKTLFKKFGRTCACEVSDLTDINEIKKIESYFPNNYVDYISFDLDDATEKVVEIFPWHTIEFGILTFEHDTYTHHSTNNKREMLDSKLSKYPHYLKLVKDIGFGNRKLLKVHEDWWININVFRPKIRKLQADTIFWKDYIMKINNL